MFTEFVLISQGQTQADLELLQIKEKEKLSSLEEARNSNSYRQYIKTNAKLLQEDLAPSAIKPLQSLKYQLTSLDIGVVVVPPHTPALLTAVELFAEKSVDVYVDPNLQPRLDSAQNLPTSDLEQFSKKFTKPPNTQQISKDPNWFLKVGPKSDTPDANINTPQWYCLDVIRQTGDFQSRQRFLNRMTKMKEQLVKYVSLSKSKKVALISHPDVLEILTATGWHQNGKLINSISFDWAQLKRQYVCLEGQQAEVDTKGMNCCGQK